MNQLDALLDGGHIERYHIKGQRMLTRQCVAEHSWRMVAILYYLWPEASAALVWATAFHDVSERVTGDMPANIKRANPEMARAVNEVSTTEERRLGIRFDLTAEEAKTLRWMDRFEGVLHCLDELEMGNAKVLDTLNRYLQYSAGTEHTLAAPERESLRVGLLEEARQKAYRFTPHFHHQGEQR